MVTDRMIPAPCSASLCFAGCSTVRVAFLRYWDVQLRREFGLTMDDSAQRSSGGTSLRRPLNAAMSARSYLRWRRSVEAGRVVSPTPARHSFFGRIGRGAKPPPQFGQTLCSTFSTHSAQNVHSKLQMRASVAPGGRSLSQYSQLGLSSNMTLSAASGARLHDPVGGRQHNALRPVIAPEEALELCPHRILLLDGKRRHDARQRPECHHEIDRVG